jgi:hypothetical protein
LRAALRTLLAALALACTGTAPATTPPVDPAAPPPGAASTPEVEPPPAAAPEVAPPAAAPTVEPGEITAMVQVDGGPPTPVQLIVGDALPPGVHPPPFSTDELRAGMPAGTRLKYRITRPDRPTVLSTWEVVAPGPREFTFRMTDTREDGTLFAPPRDEARMWVELRNHSAFPLADYERSEATVRFGGKAEPAWLYESRAPAAGRVERSWFAKRLPGPPTLYLVEDAGVEVMRMELLDRSP